MGKAELSQVTWNTVEARFVQEFKGCLKDLSSVKQPKVSTGESWVCVNGSRKKRIASYGGSCL